MKTKMGRVSSINYERGTVVVTYPETNTVSPELIVHQGRNKGKKRYNMPEIDEVGLCIIVDSSYEGMYIGSGVIDDVPLPSVSGKGLDIYEYSDGTKVMYDENTKTLTLDSVKDIVINSKENITIQAKKINISASSELTVTSALINFLDDIIIKGISFLKHVHGGIAKGGDKTIKPE